MKLILLMLYRTLAGEFFLALFILLATGTLTEVSPEWLIVALAVAVLIDGVTIIESLRP